MKNGNNYKFASNLLIGAVCLVIINSFIITGRKSGAEMILASAVFLFLLLLSILVRKGFLWLRYLFAFLIIFSLISLIMSLEMQIQRSLSGLIVILVNLLQLWALILLFKNEMTQKVKY